MGLGRTKNVWVAIMSSPVGIQRDIPVVSVCMITYNHAPYIRQAIEGVLMQKTSFSVRLCIGDDESTDGTREICKEYVEKYPDRVSLFCRSKADPRQQEYPVPGRFNFVETLKACRPSKYIALCDGDDYWIDPLKLQKQVDFLDVHSDYSLCFSNGVIEEAGRTDCFYEDAELSNLVGTPLSAEKLAEGNCIQTPSLLFRNWGLLNEIPQDLFQKVRMGDWPLLLLILQGGKGHFINHPMVVYRRHAGGVWSKVGASLRMANSILTACAMISSGRFSESICRVLENTVERWAQGVWHEAVRLGDYQYAGRILQVVGKDLPELQIRILSAIGRRDLWQRKPVRAVLKIRALFRRQEQRERMVHPLVSICIPTYNGAEFLAGALASLEAQTYANCEVIVSDDASSDRTLQIVEEFAKSSKFPVRIFHHKPSGIGANWNHCVENARGEYIKFLFQDDLLAPECVEKMVALAETDEKIGLVFCRRSLLCEDESLRSDVWCQLHSDITKRWGRRLKTARWGNELLRDPHLFSQPRNKIGEPPSVLLRQTACVKTGSFNEEMSQALDYEYWYRIMNLYKIAYIPERLCSFRVHEGQATQANERQKEKIEKNFLEHIVSVLPEDCFHPVSLAVSKGRRPFRYKVVEKVWQWRCRIASHRAKFSHKKGFFGG